MTDDEPVITSAAARPAAPRTKPALPSMNASLADVDELPPRIRRLLAADRPDDGPGFQSSI